MKVLILTVFFLLGSSISFAQGTMLCTQVEGGKLLAVSVNSDNQSMEIKKDNEAPVVYNNLSYTKSNESGETSYSAHNHTFGSYLDFTYFLTIESIEGTSAFKGKLLSLWDLGPHQLPHSEVLADQLICHNVF